MVRWQDKWLLGLVVVSTVAIFFIDRIPQDPNYHQFVDNIGQFFIPNFWNVVSNVPFFVVGLLGLIYMPRIHHISGLTVAYRLWFFGVAMVAFGSGYYHWQPSNDTLLWDRLPMTVAFMSLFAIIIAEFVSQRIAKRLLWPMVIMGVASVIYWLWSESVSAGDLRFYALIQFLPMLLIPLILCLYRSRFTHSSGYWWLLLFYVVAKILEYFDGQIYQLTDQIMSGHALKHVAAAIGVWLLLLSYKKRTPQLA